MACTLTINDEDSLPNLELDYVKKNLISKRYISQRASVHRSGRKCWQFVICCNLQRRLDLEGVDLSS